MTVAPRSASCAGFVVALAFAGACEASFPDLAADEQALASPQKVSELSTDVLNDSSAPAGFQVVNGAMMFFARSGLFRSDGTAAGTRLVRDLDTRVGIGGTPPRIVVLNGRGYWSQKGSLWTTDGTPAGTQAVVVF